MEMVSSARFAYKYSTLEEDTIEKISKSYWSGAGNIALELPSTDLKERLQVNSGVIWEYLIEGQLILKE